MDTNGNLYGAYRNGFYELKYGFGHHHNKWQAFDLSVTCSQQNSGTENIGGLTDAGQSSGAPYDGVSPLYGAANTGGANNAGTVFSLTPNGGQWTQTVLYNFCSQKNCTDGLNPAGGVILDAGGNLFGLTFEGGNNFLNVGAGVAYELSASGGSWNETVLYRFCSVDNCADGALPLGDLVSDSAGTLFGTTTAGGGNCKAGKNGCGVIFSLAPTGQNSVETVLHAFCAKRQCRDGAFPASGLSIDSSGNLYGTTAGNGPEGDVLFELSGPTYQVLHSFCSLAGCLDGEEPLARPIIGPDGNLYGTTFAGGTGSDNGTVFKYTR